jgi:hypothetical protein
MTGWAAVLFERSVHPTQVAVMEAMDWIGEPFSPVQFCAMNGHRFEVGHAGYHFRKLVDAGLIECVGQRPVRGAVEHFYRRAAS